MPPPRRRFHPTSDLRLTIAVSGFLRKSILGWITSPTVRQRSLCRPFRAGLSFLVTWGQNPRLSPLIRPGYCNRVRIAPLTSHFSQKRSASACLRSGGTLQLARLVSPNHQTKLCSPLVLRSRQFSGMEAQALERMDWSRRTIQPGYQTATHGWYCHYKAA